MTSRRQVACALAALLLPAPLAGAHVVLQRPGLRQLLQQSEVAVVVEFVSPLRMWEAPDGSDRQEYYSVRAVEAIAGDAPRAPFDVFPHAEGVPLYREGDIALLFLERTSRRPEFASLAGRFPFFTIQERGQEWKLMDRDAMAVRAAARAYQDLRSNRTADSRAALRTLLLRNLRSEVPALRADAVAELLRARSIPDFFPGPEALAPFTRLVGRESKLPLTTRVALARTLDGVQGFDADGAVRAMTTETLEREERLALLRVAGNVRDPAVSLWLGRRLGSADATERREAAYALAHPRHAARWQALSVALADPDPSVARAALRALGALGSPEAESVLRRVAGQEPSVLQRLAAAELRRAAASQAVATGGAL